MKRASPPTRRLEKPFARTSSSAHVWRNETPGPKQTQICTPFARFPTGSGRLPRTRPRNKETPKKVKLSGLPTHRGCDHHRQERPAFPRSSCRLSRSSLSIVALVLGVAGIYGAQDG